MNKTDFIELEGGCLVNINHIIAVDETEGDGYALIVTKHFDYQDSRGKDVIHDLIRECYGFSVDGGMIKEASNSAEMKLPR